ncbi:MAG TPA: RHS repeat-associated core domain-containing protein, partial [Polyangiaceae bacterium]
MKRSFPGGAAEYELLDCLGRRVALRDRAGAVVTMRYGPFGTLQRVRDAAGVAIEMSYDAMGRTTAIFDPIRGNSTTSYSSGLGETVTVVSNTGTSARVNDALDRVTREDRPEGTTRWSYDVGNAAIGKVTSVTGPPSELSPNGTSSTFAYGPISGPIGSRGRIASATQVVAGESFVIGYDYDSNGRPSKITYPGAAGTKFATKLGYDPDGTLTSIENPESTTEPKYYEVTSRTSLNEVAAERLGGRLVTNYDYYPLTGALKSAAHVLNGTEISASTLTYNETGTVSTIGLMEGGLPSNAARAFAYDVSDRLTDTYSAKFANGTWTRDAKLQSVSHDTLGNITSKSDVGTYKYERAGNPYAVTSAGAMTFQYDNLGRQTGRSGTQGSNGFTKLEYASHGQLTKVTTINSGEIRYAYNGSLEHVLSSSSDSTKVHVGGLYTRTTSKSDPTSRTHVYSIKANGQTIAEVIVQERNNAIVGTPQLRLLRNDHLGSAVLAAEPNNAIARTRYDAFGKTQDTPANSITAFAGYVNEPTAGLLRMGVRMYDPNLAVVLGPDPIASDKLGQDSFNPYAYAYSRPTQYVDPNGMDGEPWATAPLFSYYGQVWQYTYNAPVYSPPSFEAIYQSYAGASYPGPGSDPFRLNGQQYSYSQYQQQWSNFQDGLNDFAVSYGVPPMVQLINGPGPLGGISYPSISSGVNLDMFVLFGGADYSPARVQSAVSNLVNLVTTGLTMYTLSAAEAGVQIYMKSLTSAGEAAGGAAAGGGGTFSRIGQWWATGAENDAAWRTLSTQDKLFYELGQKTMGNTEFA